MASVVTTSHNRRGAPFRKAVTGRLCRCGCGESAQPSQFFASDDCRFWVKVVKGPGCWLWTSNKCKGKTGGYYPQFSLTRDGVSKPVWAHRYIYERTNGPIPDGLQVMHLCHNSLCVRPDHLQAGTPKENVQGTVETGRHHVAHPRAHKLTAEQIYEIEIRKRVASGQLQCRVAADFGITAGFVSQIIHGTTRRYDAPLRPSLAEVG